MSHEYYNNIGVGAAAIGAALSACGKLSISKSFLIYPLISHRELLSYLSRKTTNVIGVDKLIVDKMSCFTNFNKRYYESLAITVNAIQLLSEVGRLRYEDGYISLIENMPYDDRMGLRVKKIYSAANNISAIMNESKETLYISLRVEI